MSCLESFKVLLTEHLAEASTYGPEIQNCLLIFANGDYNQRVYDAFFIWVTDSTQSPESIIHLLGTYISEVDGFTTNKSIQTLVSFPCLEALARRRPAVLEGPWEQIAWIIIKYSTCSNTILGKGITNFRPVDEATLKWIVEISSPELCPNPCLRLELFRLMRSFNHSDFDYDHVSFRDKVINTIFEVFEKYTSLTVDQLPNFSPMDLQFVIKDHNISMGSIMMECDLYPMRFDIIVAILSLTRDLSLLEKGRQQKLNNQAIGVEVWNIGLKVQLSACLSFCGLLPLLLLDLYGDLEKEYGDCLHHFVQTIGNDTFLLNDVIYTLDTITQVSHCFPDEHALHDRVNQDKDKLLHRFFKGHINQLPTHQHLQEINGGFNPAAEYRLRYFQNNTMHMDQYNDSETDSECYTNENDHAIYVSEENNSEIDFPGE